MAEEEHCADPGSSIVNVTVIVCTYNRCESLPKSLECIADQSMPDGVTWEVVVVDNNSTDRTREAVEKIAAKWPGRFHYVFESRQGLSRARNAGIRAARGTVIVFTDDDVAMDRDWLHHLTSELHSGEWAGCGGCIIPVWIKPLPKWLSIDDPKTMGTFVHFQPGDEPGEITISPYGANMAFHRRVFETYGGFRVDLDRSGKRLLSSGDTEYGDRLLAAGERLRYEPDAIVFHPTPINRMTKTYVLRWWFWFGYSRVVQHGLPPDIRWVVNGIPLNFLRRIARWTLQGIVTLNPPRRFARIRTACFLAGIVAGCRDRSRHTPTSENEAGEALWVTSKSASLETKMRS